MATTMKANEMARALRDELNLRLQKIPTPVTVAEVSYDTDQNPLIKIGTGVVGAAGGLVKVKPIDWPLPVDVIGLPQRVYSIHEIQFVREAAVAANVDYLIMTIVSVLAVRGTKLRIYQSANGTAPSAAQLVDANITAVIESDLYHKMTASQ